MTMSQPDNCARSTPARSAAVAPVANPTTAANPSNRERCMEGSFLMTHDVDVEQAD